jgi:ubiquinone biosynthesis protein COQ4
MAISSACFRSAERPATKLRPLKALGHFRKLVADKEDTAQVFYMADCLPSARAIRKAETFCASDRARRLMETEPYLPDLLDDHDALLALPAGSVAHAYVSFMRKEGLSAAGLVAASDVPGLRRYPDQLQWFADRLRDTHDLAHVLTGYGRDALGEQCVLGFTDGQFHDRTDWFIAWAGALEIVVRVRSDAPVVRAVAEGHRHGKAAAAIFAEDVRALLAEPLEAARRRMGIAQPRYYQQAHARFRARGLDPYELMGAPTMA